MRLLRRRRLILVRLLGLDPIFVNAAAIHTTRPVRALLLDLIRDLHTMAFHPTPTGPTFARLVRCDARATLLDRPVRAPLHAMAVLFVPP